MPHRIDSLIDGPLFDLSLWGDLLIAFLWKRSNLHVFQVDKIIREHFSTNHQIFWRVESDVKVKLLKQIETEDMAIFQRDSFSDRSSQNPA